MVIVKKKKTASSIGKNMRKVQYCAMIKRIENVKFSV